MTAGVLLAGMQTRSEAMRAPFGLAWCLAAVMVFAGVPGASHAAEHVGLVHPVSDVQLSVPVAGVVQRVLVKPGQWVREGQALVELESAAQQLEFRRRTVILEDESELSASRARLEVVTELQRMTESVASTTSSISAGSTPARPTACRIAWAASEGERWAFNAPLNARPIGVRAVETITAVVKKPSSLRPMVQEIEPPPSTTRVCPVT